MSNLIAYHQLLSLFICVSTVVTIVLSQEAVRLDRNCYPPYFGYVLLPNPCTCNKADPQSPGVTEWVFPNGTAAKQVSDAQDGSSTLSVESPYKYALNQTYICRVRGQNGSGETYNPNFIFGPESARLIWAQEPREQLQLCSSNATPDLKLYCDVPAATVNPPPIYTAFVDGKRYGAYDKLAGKLVENGQVWRLEIAFKLRSAGNHTVYCYVRNEYAAAKWFTLQQNITVSNEKSTQC